MKNALANVSNSAFNKHVELFIPLLGAQLIANTWPSVKSLCLLHSDDSKGIWIVGSSEEWN